MTIVTIDVTPVHRDERVTIGKILKTRGVSGEVKVLPLTDIPDRFEYLTKVNVKVASDRDITVEIEGVRYYKNLVYLRFKGRNSREDVKELIGGELQVEPSESPKLPDGVYYYFEIIGATVYTDDAQYLGTVVNILETGSFDVYVVQEGEREYLIPATPEIVTHIDRKKERITIHPIEGLLDIHN